jgi:DnaJ-class molecular chaperone with C-terminal Zn finger domain
MIHDPYTVLGVPPSATEAEISKSYRRLAKLYHPDLNQGDAEAAKKMSEINVAYDLIKSGKASRGDQGGYESRNSTGGEGASSGTDDPFGFDPFDLFGFGPSRERGGAGFAQGGDNGMPKINLRRIIIGVFLFNLFLMFSGRLFFY